ncbi:MAG: DNA polymerase III subunit chi [Magnetococcales bacterium]|nr:DNA polymerase III subunit chi [Magnetococcales bacterium]MBF0151635.1 DNA polymerase III subunit chi [Magnetococcales bacterium]MBF0173174.1 DNA polymerase III subunit chi [Magnetococcales bacterium]MBF0348616.1 DNA polymerase III subunit chi [Magnetococcales bacterium]MBF0632985.1 DNA polymerase III subunit chi [Magnetococcales bacterium]
MARKESGATVVRFYQMPREGMEPGLAGLLGRIHAKELKACLVAADERQATRIDELLWTQPVDSFLPHGPCIGPDASFHPVIICIEPSDINGATVLVAAHGRFVESFAAYDMILDFVTDPTPEGLAGSRERYRRYRDAGCLMEYWIRERDSGWQLKSRTTGTSND